MEDAYDVAESVAYAELFAYIRNVIIPNKIITPVACLTERLESAMSRQNQVLSISAKKNIRRRLEGQFSGVGDIIANNSGKLLFIPSIISLKDVVLENENLKKELQVWKEKSTDPNKIIDRASLYIRETIKSEMKASSWPFYPADVDKKVYIPVPLRRFLFGVTSGMQESSSTPQRVLTLVDSLGQDLIYACTGGIYKPPKHVLLPYAIKTLPGNTELIKIMNRLGHGISYTQLEENDTALCLKKLAQSLNERVVLPTAIKPNVFTNLAWDNIDRLEETLSGQGTSHRVNGIAVQPWF